MGQAAFVAKLADEVAKGTVELVRSSTSRVTVGQIDNFAVYPKGADAMSLHDWEDESFKRTIVKMKGGLDNVICEIFLYVQFQHSGSFQGKGEFIQALNVRSNIVSGAGTNAK